MIGAAPTDPSPSARAGYLPATAAAQRTASLTSRTPTTTSTTSDNASTTSSSAPNNNNNTHNNHSHTSSSNSSSSSTSTSTSGLKPPQPSAENMDSSRRRSSLQPPPQFWDHQQGPSPAAASRRSNSHAHTDVFDDRRSSMQTPAWEQQQPQSDGTYLSPSNAHGNQRQSRSSFQQPLSERHRRSSSQQPASSSSSASGLQNPEEYDLSQGGERRASMQERSSSMQQQQQSASSWEQGGERRASRASGQLAPDARSDRRSQSSMQQPSWEQDRRLSAQRSDRRSHSSFQQPSWEQERRTSAQLASNGPPDRRSQSSMQQPSWEKQGHTGTHMPETSLSDRRSQSSIQQPSWLQQSTTNPSPAEGSRRRSHSHMEEPLSHHEPQTAPWQSNEQDSQDIRRPSHDVAQPADAVHMAPPPSRETEMPPSYLRAPPRQYMQPHDTNYHPTHNPSSSGAAPVGQSQYYGPQYAGSSHSGPTSYVEQSQSAETYYGSQGSQVVQPAYNPDAQFSPGSEYHAHHYPQQHPQPYPQQHAQQYPAHMQPPPRQSSTHRPGGRGPLPQHLSSGSWELRPTALAAPAAELATPSSIYTSATESPRHSQEDDAALAASVADLDIAERSESPGSEAPRPTFRKMTVKRAARDPTVAAKPQGPAPAEQTPAETAHVTKVSFEKTLGLYRENALRSEDGDLKFMFAKYCIEESGKAPDQKIRDKMIEEGFGLLKELGKSGNAEAMYTLGQAYLDDNQYGLAHSQLLGAAKRSHSGAMYLLGLTYEKGAGVKQNTRVAMDYYTKSAQAGYKPALYRLGMIELFGQLSGGKRDVRKGIMWLKRGAAVADREHPECLHQLALVFEDGIPPHAQQDENYAYGLLVEAAELDYAPSQYKLACCYEFERLGCERDLGEALHWYSLAAENDNADAQFALAGWYLQGLEPFLPADPQKAYAWTYRAAMKDHSKAQYAIGYFCELGIGCQQNPEKADRWYKLAAALGEERAIAKVGPIPLAKSKKDKSMGSGSSSASAPFSQGNSAAVKEGKGLFSFLKK